MAMLRYLLQSKKGDKCTQYRIILWLQVFYAITRLVLQTKKETAKDSGTREGTIKVGKSSGGKKKKCC